MHDCNRSDMHTDVWVLTCIHTCLSSVSCVWSDAYLRIHLTLSPTNINIHNFVPVVRWLVWARDRLHYFLAKSHAQTTICCHCCHLSCLRNRRHRTSGKRPQGSVVFPCPLHGVCTWSNTLRNDPGCSRLDAQPLLHSTYTLVLDKYRECVPPISCSIGSGGSLWLVEGPGSDKHIHCWLKNHECMHIHAWLQPVWHAHRCMSPDMHTHMFVIGLVCVIRCIPENTPHIITNKHKHS